MAYNTEREMGVASIEDDQMKGSAALYYNGTDSDQFYVWMFKRDCVNPFNNKPLPFCSVISTDFPGVAIDQPLSFVERAYMEPATKVGPYGLELIAPKVVHFKGIH